METIDDTNSYPALLGIDWQFDNQVIINLKKRQITFELGELTVIVPLDPTKWYRYVREGFNIEDLDNIYNMNAHKDDYVNFTIDGVLRWKSINSYTSYSDEELENWQQILHEVSTRIYTHITHVVGWIGVVVCDPKNFDGMIDLCFFIK